MDLAKTQPFRNPDRLSWAKTFFARRSSPHPRTPHRIRRADGSRRFFRAISRRRLKLAERADVSLPLGGIPIGIKDVINVKGQPCTAASQILRGYTAPYMMQP